MTKSEMDEEQKLWRALKKATEGRDMARKEYNERRTLDSIEKRDAACEKFNKILHSWQKAYDQKIREHSVYIPSRQ